MRVHAQFAGKTMSFALYLGPYQAELTLAASISTGSWPNVALSGNAKVLILG